MVQGSVIKGEVSLKQKKIDWAKLRKRVLGYLRYGFRKCPMAMLLIVSVVMVMTGSFFLTVFGKYQFKMGWEHPLFVSVMRKEYKAAQDSEEIVSDSKQQEETQEVSLEIVTEAPQQLEIPTQYKKKKKIKVKSPFYSDPGKVALTTDYPYITVDKSYYDDALFIGDSRIEGLRNYANLDNATFYCKQGLSVYTMMDEKIAKVKGKKMTIPKALKKKKFNKIYIMVGINELGIGTTQEYAKQYHKHLKTIMKLQPDAVVFIMGVMHVTSAYSDKQETYNNVNINDKNVSVAGFANGINIFYLDMNPVVTNKKGGVISKYTWDGIHLKAEYYDLWVDFLNQHGLPNEMFQAYQKE